MEIALNNFVLHKIPTDATGAVGAETIKSENEVSGYVRALLGFLGSESGVRLFGFPAGREPEAKAKLLGLLETKSFLPSSDVLAQRLCECQRKVENGVVHPQSGDLLTVSLLCNGQPCLLLAKLEQMSYLSRTTWQREAGFPFDRNRVLKTCFCTLDKTDEGVNFHEIAIYDSNSTISQFWWRDFLELVEETSNDTNSRRAYGAWKEFLVKSVKPKSEPDYHILRNSIAYYFRTQKAYVHADVVNTVLGTYRPETETLDINSLRQKAAELPEKSKTLNKRFDARFEINDKACNIRLTPIRLTQDVDLVIRSPLEDLKAVVRAEIINEEKGVFVVSEDGWSCLGGK